jgi:hypothetical protein
MVLLDGSPRQLGQLRLRKLMRNSSVLVTAGLITLLCVGATSLDAEDLSATASSSGAVTQPVTAKPEAGKTDKGAAGDSVEASKDVVTKGGHKNESQDKQPAQTPPWLQLTTTLIDKLMGWVVVALIFLFLFRQKLDALMEGIITAMTDRGVTLEIAKVKIQVSERTQDLYEDRGTRFSVSPLDLAPDPYEGFAETLEIPPQLTFQVSDYAAKWWFEHSGQDVAKLKAIEVLFYKLANDFLKAARLDEVMPDLITLSRALEACRFIGAIRLRKVLDEKPEFREALVELASRASLDADTQMVLHATGVAYMQASVWQMARSLLEPLAWSNGQPNCLTAVDAWLAAMYHNEIEKARSPGSRTAAASFLEVLLKTADDVVAKAGVTLQQMKAGAKWCATPSNAAFYRRELNKVLGIVAAFRSDYSESQDDKRKYLQRALDAYAECVAVLDPEGPAPLDMNNLADTYRQCGAFDSSQFARAHLEIDKVLASAPNDPTFINTKASILVDEKRMLEAFLALTSLRQEQMDSAGPHDIVQYIENQILAAKAIVSARHPEIVRRSQAAHTLEMAISFLNSKAAQFDDEGERTRLAADLDELLGFTYLGLPGYERRSVDCYEHLATLFDKVSGTVQACWRRRVGGVRAYTRMARMARRDCDEGTAKDQRERGQKVIKDNADELNGIPTHKKQPAALLLGEARLQLDTAMALQGLAEEFYLGGYTDNAKQLLDDKDSILAKLQGFCSDSVLGSKISLAKALSGLLRGKLIFQSDPGTYEPAALTEIEKNLLIARGQGPLLDCQADLAMGEAFLSGALYGKTSDAELNYQKAISALEFAVGRNTSTLRADTVRALADAYGRRAAVQLRVKKLKAA